MRNNASGSRRYSFTCVDTGPSIKLRYFGYSTSAITLSAPKRDKQIWKKIRRDLDLRLMLAVLCTGSIIVFSPAMLVRCRRSRRSPVPMMQAKFVVSREG